MKCIARNKKAYFDYEILETFEAGMMLTGPEVKSCRLGNINLKGSYISLLEDRPILKSAHIAHYANSILDHHPLRERALLLKKKEIGKLLKKSGEKGITIIPLEVRLGRHIKLLIGLARGRKKYDKKQHIKERDIDKRMKDGREI